jgi:integrase
MSSITKRENGKWRARYRDAAGKEHAKHFARKVDAQQWLDGETSALTDGSWAAPARGRVDFETVATAWATNPAWAESTRARNVGILTKHVLPRWGSVRLVNITHEDAQAWVSGFAASGLAAGSVRKIAGVFSSVLVSAVKSKRLKVNPADGLDLPRQRLAPRRYLSGREVEAFAEASDEWGDLVLMLAYTGLRIGELAALRVKHVHVLRRRLRIEESMTEVNGRLVWSAPKDHQRRSVPFPAFLADDVAARMEGKGPDDLLFTTAAGGCVRVRNMRRDWFDMAATSVGLEGLTPHELRHTAASLAVSAGAHVLALQRMLGHEKPSTTLDVYSDLFDDDLDAVAEALSNARTKTLADNLRTESPIPLHVAGGAS